jgi:hypothetical protein
MYGALTATALPINDGLERDFRWKSAISPRWAPVETKKHMEPGTMWCRHKRETVGALRKD